jgi:hypothetical protein
MNTIPSYVLGELAPKVLVSKGLLKPLGHPAPNAPKFFLTATLKDLERDEKWHGCHRSLQNQPIGVESKPATLRCFIHINFCDSSKGF